MCEDAPCLDPGSFPGDELSSRTSDGYFDLKNAVSSPGEGSSGWLQTCTSNKLFWLPRNANEKLDPLRKDAYSPFGAGISTAFWAPFAHNMYFPDLGNLGKNDVASKEKTRVDGGCLSCGKIKQADGKEGVIMLRVVHDD